MKRCILALVVLSGCASWPTPKPYSYTDSLHAGEDLCATLGTAATSRSDSQFIGGVIASVLGVASAATLAAIPDGNLKIESFPGAATRAAGSTVAGGVAALGLYLLLASGDTADLAASTKHAQMFGEGEAPGQEYDRAAWSMCLQAWGEYDSDSGSLKTSWSGEEP